jgi:hypothetical protein
MPSSATGGPDASAVESMCDRRQCRDAVLLQRGYDRHDTSYKLISGGSGRLSSERARVGDIGAIAKSFALSLPGGECAPGSFGDHPPFLLCQGGVEVQHEGISIDPEFGM